MTTLSALKKEFENTLKIAGVENAPLDVQLLVSAVLDLDAVDYVVDQKRQVTANEYNAIFNLVKKRAERMPISQILGHKEFWSLPFKVTKDTLTPRPDSETLIEVCLAEISDTSEDLEILDMGTGTGCLLLALLSELPSASGLGVDISKEALFVARENARRLKLEKRTDFILSNWTDVIPPNRKFDIIICNPPYIGFEERASLSSEVKDYEPEYALFSDYDGLKDYEVISKQIKPFLKPEGMAIFEIGYTQANQVKKIFISRGFNSVSIHKDLAKKDRCLVIKP